MHSFLTNYTEITFLDRIRECLKTCNSFKWSVSFIKKAGLVLIKDDIENALKRGIKAKIITSTYQNFTDIESLRIFFRWMKLYPNFECHLDHNSIYDPKSYEVVGYHSKGYIFEYGNNIRMIVGSSNITRFALLKNIEWDLEINDHKDSKVYHDINIEFKDKWDRTYLLNNTIIEEYSKHIYYAVERWDMDYELSYEEIKPNYMQRKALKEINRFRAMGSDKALIISAAGSGKTYLAAFDALNFNPDRLLYIVHESSILEKSLDTFKQVFKDEKEFGLYNGSYKDIDAEYLFATNMSMANNLELFDRDEFDYIIIDECHHIAADTYKRIVEYFMPQFLLGLTATPDRMDNEDVYSFFDRNVPFVLRLRDAIANNLVVPFKYHGIRDEQLDYDNKKQRKMIASSILDDHISFVVDKIEKYRPAGKLKALAFASTKSHARMLSIALGEYYQTAYLTGEDSTGARIRAYDDLQREDGGINILCTVDILNEGVDIPGVNMVLFLRPTESSTIFIQQLGRGLRKYENKEYVQVLDFVGNNYARSVQVAYALSSLSNNFIIEKKLMKDLIYNNFKALGLDRYGVEIEFDEYSKEEILRYIEKENFNSKAYLEKDYRNFKLYLNLDHYPSHMDYLNNDCAPDLIRLMRVKMGGGKNNSYYGFLSKIREDIPIFNRDEIDVINYLSNMLPLVRPYEYLIVKNMIDQRIYDLDEIKEYIEKKYRYYNDDEYEHTIEYFDEGIIDIIKVNHNDEFKKYLLDLLEYGLIRFKEEFEGVNGFKLFASYRKEQVQILLNRNPHDIMKGTYLIDDEIYIFVGLKKDENLDERLKYSDRFLNSKVFEWESENNIKHKKPNDQDLINAKKAHVFVRKMEEENGLVQPFIYVGDGKMTNPRYPENKTTIMFDIILNKELSKELQFDFEIDEINLRS